MRRPSVPTVLSLLALVAAVTSPAWGSTVKKLITGKQIAANAITSSKVKNGALLAKDFKAGQLPAGPQGLKGDPGAKGDQGAQGPQGVAGPTVAGGASTSSGFVGAIGGTFVDLATGHTTTGQLVLPFKGLILANGDADVTDGAATASRTRCQLMISDGTGPNNNLTQFGENSFGDTPAVSNYHITIPLAGTVVKNPGTYNIAIQCFAVTNSPVSYDASFTYVVVPAP